MSSCVKYQSKYSDWINVFGLINEFEQSVYGMCLYNMIINSPTVADDMLLASYSVQVLNKMLEICENYSKR